MIHVRPLDQADHVDVLNILQNAYMGTPVNYTNFDGPGFVAVDETNPPVGVVLYWLGRPITYVRELAVTRIYRGSLVPRLLLRQVYQLAELHGAQYVDGFTRVERIAKMVHDSPIVATRGWRLRGEINNDVGRLAG